MAEGSIQGAKERRILPSDFIIYPQLNAIVARVAPALPHPGTLVIPDFILIRKGPDVAVRAASIYWPVVTFVHKRVATRCVLESQGVSVYSFSRTASVG